MDSPREYIGYPCMNRTLRDQEPPIRCNRDMRKSTFQSKGLDYASELTVQNFRDLKKILEWNVENDIYFYRCTSNLVPWNSEYSLSELPDYTELSRLAQEIGEYIQDNNIRLSFHPSHWVKLASPTESTVQNSRQSLENHGAWLDLLGLPQTTEFPINIHIGAHYNDKESTAERFRTEIQQLSDSVSQRLVVENDDTDSLWSVSELVSEIAEETGTPITFDYHHHQFTSRGLSYRDGFKLAAQTWSDDIEPVVHYSEPAVLYGEDTNPQAHAYSIHRIPTWLRQEASVMVEAGGKELAILDFI